MASRIFSRGGGEIFHVGTRTVARRVRKKIDLTLALYHPAGFLSPPTYQKASKNILRRCKSGILRKKRWKYKCFSGPSRGGRGPADPPCGCAPEHFAFSNIFKIKWPNSEEKLNFGVGGTVRWKGSEGSKQTKHTTRKLTPWWFQKCIFFFENSPTPFFGNVGFVKFGTFSAVLALPVMVREGCGQIVYETLPHILLSNASLVTKSCIARFVEGDAFNPSALNDCSTGPSPPLAHAKST